MSQSPKVPSVPLKRLTDLLASALGLLVLLPLGLLIAVAVKVGDGGPVLYGQTRVGRGGREFRIWKFRTMVPNADRLGMAVTQGRDPRITRVGRWLRKTKLDELPQLWNVLVGDMSLVGPRPEVPRYVALYTESQREVLKVRPGITDVASLAFRHEQELLAGAENVEEFYVRHCLPRKIELNMEYLERATWWSDVGVVGRTLGLWDFGTLGPSDFRTLGKGDVGTLGLWDVGTLERWKVALEDVKGRVAVVGAGEAGRWVVEQLLGRDGTEVVAVFDEDARRWHGCVAGIRVVGMPECLLNVGRIEKVETVVLTGKDWRVGLEVELREREYRIVLVGT